jgi:hypothetical protein
MGEGQPAHDWCPAAGAEAPIDTQKEHLALRVRITSRRLERLADRFALIPPVPQVLWLSVVGPTMDGARRVAVLDAIEDAVWDKVAPLAMRGEILVSIDVFDAYRARVTAVGRWWDLELEIGPAPPSATIVGRGLHRWLQERLGHTGDANDVPVAHLVDAPTGAHGHEHLTNGSPTSPGRSRRRPQRNTAGRRCCD